MKKEVSLQTLQMVVDYLKKQPFDQVADLIAMVMQEVNAPEKQEEIKEV